MGKTALWKKHFLQKIRPLKKQSCSQSKFLFLVLKGQADPPLLNTFQKVAFLHLDNQIFWCFYTSIFHMFDLTSFLTPEKLEWKLTVCIGKFTSAVLWSKTVISREVYYCNIIMPPYHWTPHALIPHIGTFERGTMEFLIDEHVRLFISQKKSYLLGLIRDCSFINFGHMKTRLHICHFNLH